MELELEFVDCKESFRHVLLVKPNTISKQQEDGEENKQKMRIVSKDDS